MLEITWTQGLLDHDTSQAVLIIWTAPSAPLIFYLQQFIQSSVCTHTLIHRPLHPKKKKKAFSSVPVCMARCFCMACSDDSETERQSERGPSLCASVCVWQGGEGGGICSGTAAKACRRGVGDARQAARLLYRVPVLCLIESMSALRTGCRAPHTHTPTTPHPTPPLPSSPYLTQAGSWWE